MEISLENECCITFFQYTFYFINGDNVASIFESIKYNYVYVTLKLKS